MTDARQDAVRRPERAATAGRHQALARRLVDAAEAAINTAGLRDLRARALADAAGCSVGAIYGVFPDLDALVLAVNARTLEAIARAMRAASAYGVGGPAGHLCRLAEAYLDYASDHRERWGVLFGHRLASGEPLPDWYVERRAAAFDPIAAALAALCPDLPATERASLARALFSAVHGMVLLGLEGRISEPDLRALRGQVRAVVGAIARGLPEP